MIRKISVLFLVTAVGLAFVSNASSSTDNWKSPKVVLKGQLPGPNLASGDRPVVQQTFNVVSGEVTNLRVLLGGGRKLIRHDCDGTPGDEALEVIFAKDIGYPDMTLHSALSSDEGSSWGVVGPISWDATQFRDRSHCIAFCNNLTYIGYQEAASTPSGNSMLFFTSDLFKCLQAFNPFTVVTDSTLLYDEYFLQQAMTSAGEFCNVYQSFIDYNIGNPYTTYVRYSEDSGTTWSDYINITDNIGTDGFDMAGMDGALSMDADGDFVAALAMVALDSAWAAANGFLYARTYPAYTQSTDGGDTWSDLQLVLGNVGSEYPHGHTADPVFNATINYIGGVQDVGYTAFNNLQDNVAVTSDGLAHLTYTLEDSGVGYVAVFHTLVDNGVITNEYVGFEEQPVLEGESGVGALPSITEADDGHVVVGWTEFMQGTGGGSGDICLNVIPVGEVAGTGPVNVTQTVGGDETYQRIADKTVPTGNPEQWYIDWLFTYYDPVNGPGNAVDTTLWHLQATYSYSGPGIEDDDTKGPGLPKMAALGQNYPNPFNPTTSISYSLSEKGRVVLEIMNLRGQHVATLVDGVREAGSHSITWDGKNGFGHTVSSGIYFYRLRTDGGFNATKKLVLLK
jgi:hypothetical protein